MQSITLNSMIVLTTAILLCTALPAFADKPADMAAFDAIRAAVAGGDRPAAEKLCGEFLRKYPGSEKVPGRTHGHGRLPGTTRRRP